MQQRLLSCGLLALLLCSPCLAQPKAPVEPVSAFDPVALSPSDAVLQTPITLDARRMTLPDFARQLGTLAKTTITLPSELATRQITAHLEGQPLGETLRSLSRLYGLEWQHVAGGWKARVAASDLERAFLQAGNIEEWQNRVAGRDELRALAAKMMVGQDRTLLESEAGVPLSAMPNLADELRQSREMASALSLLSDWGASSPFLLRGGWVHVEVPRIAQKGAANLAAPRFSLHDAGGRTAADLGAMTLPGDKVTPTPR